VHRCFEKEIQEATIAAIVPQINPATTADQLLISAFNA